MTTTEADSTLEERLAAEARRSSDAGMPLAARLLSEAAEEVAALRCRNRTLETELARRATDLELATRRLDALAATRPAGPANPAPGG